MTSLARKMEDYWLHMAIAITDTQIVQYNGLARQRRTYSETMRRVTVKVLRKTTRKPAQGWYDYSGWNS